MRHLLLLSFALPGALLAPGSDAGAQGAPPDRARAQATVTGVVRDTAGAPVAYADVAGAAGRVLSDSMGRFLLENVPPGRVVLQVRRIGYRAASWSGTAGGGERLTAELTLVPIPRDLEAVVVEASGGQARRMRGFYQRRQRNGGHFLTRDDIAPHDDSRLTDLLRARVPGVSLTSSGPGPTRLRLRNQRCAPMVWIDGASTPAAEFDVDVIQPFTVAAIEVYPGTATTPAEFRTSFGRDNCGGTIVIWSRIGPLDDDGDADSRVAVAEPGPQAPVFHADEVDEPAAIDTMTMAQPAYPDSLRAFAVAGEAVARFVVDTTGAPVVGSIEILSATHERFADAVRRAVSVSVFVPARRNGLVVRQVMLLPFRFSAPAR